MTTGVFETDVHFEFGPRDQSFGYATDGLVGVSGISWQALLIS